MTESEKRDHFGGFFKIELLVGNAVGIIPLVLRVRRQALATSLIPLDTIFPEICAFIIGFSCTVWTKMRSLAGSLADGVLADAIILSPRP